MIEQEKYMKAALKLAHRAAEEGEVPVGAVVVCDGKIVGRGRNRRETKKNALHHAEIEAIEKACKKLGGWRLHRCDLYVTLEPCPMCAGAIINERSANSSEKHRRARKLRRKAEKRSRMRSVKEKSSNKWG